MKKLWSKIGVSAFWLGWPVLFTYLYFSTRTRVIISYEGEILLVKTWLGPGRWILPGGGLHHREDTILGALREVEEETGIQLDAKQIKFLEKRRVSDNGLSSNLVIYSVELLVRPPFRPQKLELLDIGWFPAATILDRKDVSRATKHLVRSWQGIA